MSRTWRSLGALGTPFLLGALGTPFILGAIGVPFRGPS